MHAMGMTPTLLCACISQDATALRQYLTKYRYPVDIKCNANYLTRVDLNCRTSSPFKPLTVRSSAGHEGRLRETEEKKCVGKKPTER